MHRIFETYMDSPGPWLGDGGLETDALFNHGFDLPAFASFTLIEGDRGRDYVTAYFDRFFGMAQAAGTGLVLDTLTWRANAPWLERMGRGDQVVPVNRDAVAFARALRARHPGVPCILNGLIGPAGDGYLPGEGFTPEAAAAAHRPQIRALAEAGVEMLTAMTMTHTGEAQGVVQAAAEAGLPLALSFTVETMDACPRARPCARPLPRWMPPLPCGPPITWSTVPIPTISPMCWTGATGCRASGDFAPMPRA